MKQIEQILLGKTASPAVSQDTLPLGRRKGMTV